MRMPVERENLSACARTSSMRLGLIKLKCICCAPNLITKLSVWLDKNDRRAACMSGQGGGRG